MRDVMKPLLVYDGDCGFCRFWVERWRARTGDRVDYAPSSEVAGRFPEISAEAFARAVQFVDTDGTIHEGAGGALRALALAPSGGLALRLYRNVPGAAAAAEWAYRLVARHRSFFSWWVRLLWGRHIRPPTYAIFSCLFTRLIGLVYLIAFLSLWGQVTGLAGRNGILPARLFLDAVHARYGAEAYGLIPTLSWIDSGDGFLRLLCGAGAFVSLLVIAGLLPAPGLAALFILYLSLVSVCRTFLSFQWDALLLEAGFLAILLAPLRWRCRIPCPTAPPRAILWLTRWLLFRLMFSSGMVKLTSGDETWHNLTALDYHYWTQPLPNRVAWFVHHLPGGFHELSVAVMFVIELAVPFLIFGPRRLRLFAAAMLALQQLVIAATGNYTYFNLLSLVLCLVLLDDDAWPRAWRRGRQPVPSRRWPLWITAPLVAILVLVTTQAMTSRFRWQLPWPHFTERLAGALRPFRIANAYGLFAVMTTTRHEIVVEGSNDGQVWLPYGFKWKPGDPARAPGFVAPHQPRLDWQMWFAALSNYRRTPWFQNFLYRLLQGSPEVLSLLEHNPFPEAPPRYIRSVVYDYRFTDPATRRATGEWWSRELIGLYSPVQSLPGR